MYVDYCNVLENFLRPSVRPSVCQSLIYIFSYISYTIIRKNVKFSQMIPL